MLTLLDSLDSLVQIFDVLRAECVLNDLSNTINSTTDVWWLRASQPKAARIDVNSSRSHQEGSLGAFQHSLPDISGTLAPTNGT